MNTKDFTYLLQHPEKVVTPLQTKQLEEVLEEFPYFQTAHALHLKGLKNLNSFKYNKALKKTAARTTDREILFDFITSKEFLQNNIANSLTDKSPTQADKETESKQIVETEPQAVTYETKATTSSEISEDAATSKKASDADEVASPSNTFDLKKSSHPEDESLSLSKEEAEALLDPRLFRSKDPSIDQSLSEAKKKASEELEIGEPLPFSKKEKYSFGEWLQLTNFKPVRRDKKPSEPEKRKISDISFPLKEDNPNKRTQSDLIDRFIAENPKINPQKEVPKITIVDSVKFDQKELMTETLARVYLEQKKYKKAMQAYKILSLKYPEKSGFFADRIKAVERLKGDET